MESADLPYWDPKGKNVITDKNKVRAAFGKYRKKK